MLAVGVSFMKYWYLMNLSGYLEGLLMIVYTDNNVKKYTNYIVDAKKGNKVHFNCTINTIITMLFLLLLLYMLHTYDGAVKEVYKLVIEHFI